MDRSYLSKINPSYVDNLSLYYTKILSHAITTDGKYLFAAVKAGYLAVFPLKQYLKEITLLNETSPQSENLCQSTKICANYNRLRPCELIPTSNSLSLCLDTTNISNNYKFILGGKGTIKGYTLSFSNIAECCNEWTIRLSNDSTLVNTISLSKENILFGCSDNNIYVHNKETHQEINKLTGHQDYIHCLKITDDKNQIFYSGSEDGSVRMWDIRASNEAISTILPFKNQNIERVNYGKWIGAIDVSPNNEWLICGGGPALSIWHIRSNKYVYAIDTPGVSYVAQFLETDSSRVMAAGSDNQVTVWQMSEASIESRIHSSIDNIYSICHHNYEDFEYDLYSFSGDSFKLELCKNEKYIDCELYVY